MIRSGYPLLLWQQILEFSCRFTKLEKHCWILVQNCINFCQVLMCLQTHSRNLLTIPCTYILEIALFVKYHPYLCLLFMGMYSQVNCFTACMAYYGCIKWQLITSQKEKVQFVIWKFFFSHLRVHNDGCDNTEMVVTVILLRGFLLDCSNMLFNVILNVNILGNGRSP